MAMFIYMKSAFAKTDKSCFFLNNVFYYVIMFLLCFIVLGSCTFLFVIFFLIKIAQ